jgi:hypothetical protein
MNKTIIFAGIGIVAAAGLFFVARNAQQPPAKQAQGSLYVRTSPKLESICVKGVQNRSGRQIDMTGIDDVLVAEIKKTGLQSRKLADASGGCDATVYSEVANISGRKSKTAEVDYRLELANEQAPRISATAKGKSGEEAPDSASAVEAASTDVPAKKQAQAEAERKAVLVALGDVAQKISIANKQGLPERAAGN